MAPLPTRNGDPRPIPAPEAKAGANKLEDPSQAEIQARWKSLGLVTRPRGQPYHDWANVVRVLEGWPAYKDIVWWGEVTPNPRWRPFLTRWRWQHQKGGADPETPRQWQDSDTRQLTCQMQGEFGLYGVTTGKVREALRIYADERAAREGLRSPQPLPTTDPDEGPV